MAGAGADPDECQGSGADYCNDLVGRVAGVGKAGPQEDRRLGGLGPDECGQWQEARLSQDERWTDGSAERVIHVDLGGDEVQPVDPGAVPAVIEEGQGEEGGIDGVYAEVPNDLECDDARQSSIQAEGRCLRWAGFPFNGDFVLDFQDSCCTLCWAVVLARLFSFARSLFI